MRLPLALSLLICSGIAVSGPVHAQYTADATPVTPVLAPPGGVAHGLLYEKHLAAGVSCMACHPETPSATAANAAACLNCHGPRPALIAKTAGDAPNPHAQAHVGPIPCTACHHIHVASGSYCNKCHTFDMTMP
jgi:hypothetical protein